MRKKYVCLFVILIFSIALCGCKNKTAIDDVATGLESTAAETTISETTTISTEAENESTETVETTSEIQAETIEEQIMETEIVYDDEKLLYLSRVYDTDQMILIIGTGYASDATMYFYNKTNDGWILENECNACIGQNGFSYSTYEGDRTTPCGVFNVGVAFGIQSNPGTALDWFDVDDGDVWVDDINSVYYNQLIDKYETPDGWESGEHLIDYTDPYAYAFNIEVNPPYQTSAIFFHCFGPNQYTGGCVAVSEDNCIWVLQNIHSGAKITIVPAESDLRDLY